MILCAMLSRLLRLFGKWAEQSPLINLEAWNNGKYVSIQDKSNGNSEWQFYMYNYLIIIAIHVFWAKAYTHWGLTLNPKP